MRFGRPKEHDELLEDTNDLEKVKRRLTAVERRVNLLSTQMKVIQRRRPKSPPSP